MVNVMMFLKSVYIYIHLFNTLQSCPNVFPNLISMHDPENLLREFVRFYANSMLVLIRNGIHKSSSMYDTNDFLGQIPKHTRLLPIVTRSKSLMASCMPSRRLIVNGPSVFCVHENSM